MLVAASSCCGDVFQTGKLVRNEGMMDGAKYREFLEENLFQSSRDLRLGQRFTILLQQHSSGLRGDTQPSGNGLVVKAQLEGARAVLPRKISISSLKLHFYKSTNESKSSARP